MTTKAHTSGRAMVDWQWFQQALTNRAQAEGYTSVGFHITPKARSRFRLSGTIRGAHVTDKDRIIEYYVVASTQKDFERRVLHEEGHEFEPFVPETSIPPQAKDSVLHYYALHDDYAAFYRRVDVTNYQPTTVSSLLPKANP